MRLPHSCTLTPLIFGILVLVFGIAFYTFSFTSPTAPPPGGNVPAPINVGSDFQQKTGDLWVRALGVDNGVVAQRMRLVPGNAPGDPQTGDIYYNQGDNKVYIRKPDGWIEFLGLTGGGEGVLAVNTGIVTINQEALGSVSGTSGNPYLDVSSNPKTKGFAVGETVLLIQMTGTGAGNYEKKLIGAFPTNTQVQFTENKVNTYTNDGSSKAQMIKVPQYKNVTVASGATLAGPAWNGATGGVLVFDVQGDVTNAGTITMTAKGFAQAGPGKGGAGSSGGSNGAPGRSGGAGGAPGGGGGGSYGTQGTRGDSGTAGDGGRGGAQDTGGGAGSSGSGGPASSTYGTANLLQGLLLGSSGGSGATGASGSLICLWEGNCGSAGGGGTGVGGNGGGIIFIQADKIDNTNTGTIDADGQKGNFGGNGATGVNARGSYYIQPQSDGSGDYCAGASYDAGGGGAGGGGGGGGSGGSILLIAKSVNLGKTTAVGGSGGIGGNGGSGGDGAVSEAECGSIRYGAGGGGVGTSGGAGGLANGGIGPGGAGANAPPGSGGNGGNGRIQCKGTCNGTSTPTFVP